MLGTYVSNDVTVADRLLAKPKELTVPGNDFAHADDLVARVRNGDVSAVGELYDLHNKRVRAFARRLLADDAAAEDLVHEVFITAPKAMKNFRGESTVGTFLVAIAAQHARHHIRGAIRRRNAMARFKEESESVARSDPEQDAARERLRALLVRGLDTLPDEQRVAFVLCEVEEQSSMEVASLMGIPPETVRTRVFHARRKLREFLTEEGVS